MHFTSCCTSLRVCGCLASNPTATGTGLKPETNATHRVPAGVVCGEVGDGVCSPAQHLVDGVPVLHHSPRGHSTCSTRTRQPPASVVWQRHGLTPA